jgi:hypothetical protein
MQGTVQNVLFLQNRQPFSICCKRKISIRREEYMRTRWILAPNDDSVEKRRLYQRASWSVENISIRYIYIARKSQFGR